MDDASEQNAEADPRFPSGPWVGFWLQRRMPGRNRMRDLVLRFRNCRVDGHGTDCVGAFTFEGQYDLSTARVKLHKRYAGAHTVLYEGQNDDDGRWVWGVWTLREAAGVDRGGFHIWPKGHHDPSARQVAAAHPVELAPPEPVPV
ncbi:MAG TPA: hypothetical protein VGM03_14910 [Phycisphaerae bacterium]|jgi:hypothetical protein